MKKASIVIKFFVASLVIYFSAAACAGSQVYNLKGRTYHPLTYVNSGFTQFGTASYYSVADNFGFDTSSGEILNNNAMTAASPVLPMNTKVMVTNLKNGKSVIVRINDRGPYNSIHGAYKSKRIIDLTIGAARKLDYEKNGTTRVKVTVV